MLPSFNRPPRDLSWALTRLARVILELIYLALLFWTFKGCTSVLTAPGIKWSAHFSPPTTQTVDVIRALRHDTAP